MKKIIPVDKHKLSNIINNIEQKEKFDNRSQLFKRVSELYGDIKVTPTIIYLRVRDWQIPITTPKGKKLGNPNIKSIKNISKIDVLAKNGLLDLKKQVDKKYHKTINQTIKGSMKAAIKLKCLDCTCHQIKEIKSCLMYDCPLYGFRPYK